MGKTYSKFKDDREAKIRKVKNAPRIKKVSFRDIVEATLEKSVSAGHVVPISIETAASHKQ